MATVTKWLKSLNPRWREYEATIMAGYDTEARVFNLILQSEGRLMRCRLTLREVTTLYGSMTNYLSRARYARDGKAE